MSIWHKHTQNVKFLAIFWHSNGNFPEGQQSITAEDLVDRTVRAVWLYLQFLSSCNSSVVIGTFVVIDRYVICVHNVVTREHIILHFVNQNQPIDVNDDIVGLNYTSKLVIDIKKRVISLMSSSGWKD